MGKVVQVHSHSTKTTTKRVKKVPSGYHRCPNCGGDGICKNKKKRKG